MGRESPPTALAPGFRFHPTDEELVSYYLKRKVCGKSFRFDAISDVDIYKSEPWDLPRRAGLKSRDQEWYFFSALDKKYGNGARMNRATSEGYWKTTGKDRAVNHNLHTLGMKKTLVFHIGRAPDGKRTDWVMHEYRLVDEELENAGVAQDVYVLCRIFQKNGLGPPNGNRYAPFVEEEWDDGVSTLVTGKEAGDEVVAADDTCLEANNVQQDFESIGKAPFCGNELPIETENVLPIKSERLDDPPFPCVVNREAPFPPLLQYKRRHIEESNQPNASENSSRINQDPCSSATTVTPNIPSALVESIEPKEPMFSLTSLFANLMGVRSDNSLGPGFRFHPTDEELVRYYLRRKVSAKSFRFDPISVVDIYKSEPWDLPDKSKLKSRDLEWYFFSMLDKKNGNGSRMNRATEKGYWKTTGKDRPVLHHAKTVGLKKTLVYHCGRPPRGERTNWVMHEYRLADADLEKAGVAQDAFVLCRIFQKSGSGPKNGEQYGAPFIEEEWEDDEVVFLPVQEAKVEEVVAGDVGYLEVNDIDQKFDFAISSENTTLPLSFYYGDTSKSVEPYEDYIDNDQNPITGLDENQCASELHNDQKLAGLAEQCEVDAKSVQDDLIGEPTSNVDLADVNFLGETFLDAADYPLLDEGLFIETNDLSDPVEADYSGFDMLEEYLTYFDADDNSDDMAFDPSIFMGSENSVPDNALSLHTTDQHANEATEQSSMASQHLFGPHGITDACSSKQNQEDTKSNSGFMYPFIKHATQLLGDIPAPPAFASEFPTKDSALSSSSVHVRAGMIRIRNTTLSGNGMDWSFGKNGNLNITLSFGLSQGDDSSASLTPVTSILSGKTGSLLPRGWFYLMFIWGLILVSVSFKIGSCIYTR